MATKRALGGLTLLGVGVVLGIWVAWVRGCGREESGRRSLLAEQIDGFVRALDRSAGLVGISPSHPAAIALVSVVQAESAARDLLADELRGASSDLLRGNLLYILYAGTDARRWRDELLELARRDSDASPHPEAFWRIFSEGSWSGEDLAQITDMAVDVLLSGEYRERHLPALAELARVPEIRAGLAKHERYPELVGRGVRAALEAERGTLPGLTQALERVAALDARAFLAAAVSILADPRVSREGRETVQAQIAERRMDLLLEGPEALSLPESVDPVEWKRWGHTHREFLAPWFSAAGPSARRRSRRTSRGPRSRPTRCRRP